MRGRVTEPGEFIELPGDALRSLVARDAELSEIFMRAFILRRLQLVNRGQGILILLGSSHSAATLRLREFLTRNEHPYTYVDLDSDKTSQELLDRFNVKLDEIPVIICSGRKVLKNPTNRELADCLGLNIAVDESTVRDLIIVGAGPAGLAAAVYGASEGLDVLVIETGAPGGQAAASSKIENYLGFPTGLSGQELAARALAQAEKFGAKMMVAHSVEKLDCARHPYKVVLDNGNRIAARAVVIATGAQYNKPRIANLALFEGQGIYYGATFMESQLCGDEELIVVGGGNSAGQAAVLLSQTARKVHIVVRSGKLADTMSRYLFSESKKIPRSSCTTKLKSWLSREIPISSGFRGSIKIPGQLPPFDIRHLFIMAGASPRTEWLRGCIALDEKGFILTGRDLDGTSDLAEWTLPRRPQMLETNLPGIFAVGDVRSASVKRVASAVGEGAIAIHFVHRALLNFSSHKGDTRLSKEPDWRSTQQKIQRHESRQA